MKDSRSCGRDSESFREQAGRLYSIRLADDRDTLTLASWLRDALHGWVRFFNAMISPFSLSPSAHFIVARLMTLAWRIPHFGNMRFEARMNLTWQWGVMCWCRTTFICLFEATANSNLPSGSTD